MLQQYLPFTVLKPYSAGCQSYTSSPCVATVLTVYGIETLAPLFESSLVEEKQLQQYLPFTVLKLVSIYWFVMIMMNMVATVLTVYGIETIEY